MQVKKPFVDSKGLTIYLLQSAKAKLSCIAKYSAPGQPRRRGTIRKQSTDPVVQK
jgi:hypothetical protein